MTATCFAACGTTDSDTSSTDTSSTSNDTSSTDDSTMVTSRKMVRMYMQL
jgi:hypothetical protein